MLGNLFFIAFSTLALLGALGVVLAPNLIYAALCLLAVFISVAGFFLMNAADFLAVAQILVYAVGLTIIILFALMFTGKEAALLQPNKASVWWKGATVAGLIGSLAAFALSAVSAFFPLKPISPSLEAVMLQQGTVGKLGELLLTKYLLPFEVASVLLLMAMVGAIVIAKRTLGVADDESLKYTPKNADEAGMLAHALKVTTAAAQNLPPSTPTAPVEHRHPVAGGSL
jgi:NADH:ubiquinone oxidoreductase subunit 6 (subunit J)